jgi:hypothetical protein
MWLPIDICRKIIDEHIEGYLLTIATKEEAKILFDEYIK